MGGSAIGWLAGLIAVGLFAYLFYALIKPERF
jgi:K+-transporting ATPase KdpF subunit